MLERHASRLIDLDDSGELQQMIIQLLDVTPLNVGIEDGDEEEAGDSERSAYAEQGSKQQAQAQGAHRAPSLSSPTW